MNGDDEQLLRQRMVTLWWTLWEDHPGFQNEERPLRANWAQTRRQIDGLAEQIEMNGPNHGQQVPRPVEMAALDAVLYRPYLQAGWHSISLPPVVVNGQEFVVYPRSAPRPPSRHDQQSGNLAFWLRHHRIFPRIFHGYTMKIRTMGEDWIADLPKEGSTLRVYMGTFPDRCAPAWLEEHMPAYCVATTVDQPEIRLASILAALEEARTAEAQLVLLPELAVFPEHREEIERWLKREEHPFLWVVPGSFHVGNDHFSSRQGQIRGRNRSGILDGDGWPILEQDKLFPYGVLGDEGCLEGVESSDALHLLDTPIGLIALAICRDFLQESSPIPEMWEMIAPDWIWVPSMSDGLSGHKTAAQRLFRMYTTRVLVVNQCRHGRFQGVRHGFVFADGVNCQVNRRRRVMDIPILDQSG